MSDNLTPSEGIPGKHGGTLFPWRKGYSPNPGARPGGKRVSTWLAEFGQMDPSELPDPRDPKVKLPINARIALARLRKACTDEGLGDAAWAVERLEGKAEQSITLKAQQLPPMSLEKAAEIIKRAKLEQDI